MLLQGIFNSYSTHVGPISCTGVHVICLPTSHVGCDNKTQPGNKIHFITQRFKG